MTNQPLKITTDQMRWFRLQRSGLIDPFPTPEAAASALIGVQAQIEPAAALSLWNRTTGLTAGEFGNSLYKTRSFVKLWGQRGTLHLYASQDWPLIYAMREVNRTGWERYIHLLDMTASEYDEIVARVAAILRQVESLGRAGLQVALAEQGTILHKELYSPWGGVFADLVRRGYACHAGRIGGEGHFAHRERWLPGLDWNPSNAEDANLTVLRRYLHTYAPASMADFNYWRSPSGKRTRQWFEKVKGELCEIECDGKMMLALREDLAILSQTPPAADAWPVKMLFRFEPYLLAHKDKEWVVDSNNYKRVFRPAGHIEGIVLAHGRAVGTWGYEKKGKGIMITVAAFAPFPQHVQSAIEAITPQIAAFFGLSLTDVSLA